MATESQTTKYAIRKLVLSAFILSRVEVVEGSHKKPLIMQNKPNFQKAQMNASTVLTKDYDNWTLGERGKNKPNTNPIQTQYKANSNPIKPKTNPIKANYFCRCIRNFSSRLDALMRNFPVRYSLKQPNLTSLKF